jgi:hypothetical protein
MDGGKNDLLYLSTVRFLGSSRSPIYLRIDQDAFDFGFASRKVKEKDAPPSLELRAASLVGSSSLRYASCR